jgi:hypothetical protein
MIIIIMSSTLHSLILLLLLVNVLLGTGYADRHCVKDPYDDRYEICNGQDPYGELRQYMQTTSPVILKGKKTKPPTFENKHISRSLNCIHNGVPHPNDPQAKTNWRITEYGHKNQNTVILLSSVMEIENLTREFNKPVNIREGSDDRNCHETNLSYELCQFKVVDKNAEYIGSMRSKFKFCYKYGKVHHFEAEGLSGWIPEEEPQLPQN